MKIQFVIFGALVLSTAALLPVSAATLMYENIPAPLPPNVPSLGYQATQTAEFGDLIQFAPGTPRSLSTVTALMSDWALASTYGSSDAGWSVPITLNLYNVDNSSGTAQPGTVIDSVTQTFLIPWRPEASAGCGTAWLAADNNCYNGLAFDVTFDLGNITVPDQLIYGIAYNTQSYGAAPTGQTGPYNSLNFGLSTVAPTTGSNPLPNAAYWNTQTGSTFRQVSGWSAYSGAVEFASTSAPEPGTVGLMLGGGLLIMMGSIRRKKQSKQ